MISYKAHATKHTTLSRYWLLVGASALAIAGLFSLVLVMARAPISDATIFTDWFHKTLVVHVDLSVLVWFLAMACLLWSRVSQPTRPLFPYLEEAALICFALGTIFITISPFDSSGAALMSNYIPVIHGAWFFLGLAMIFCGTGLMLIQVVSGKLQVATGSAALIAFMALICFFLSYRAMPPGAHDQNYYDTLFWGGGHVLQLLHVQMMMVCWILLASGIRYQESEKYLIPDTRYLIPIFAIGPVAALAAPLAYRYDITSFEHRNFFTQMMIAGNGIAPTVLAFLIIPGLWRARGKNALWSSFAMSVILFLYGGILGGMIQGQNVTIPAHYHGSIVGVTLAFMAAAYVFLPQFGYRDVTAWRLAFWQPIVYGGGQLLHISGLAISGGYGVLRKTPGGLDALPASAKAAMGLMGIGGTIAIIGGFMFVIVIAKSVLGKDRLIITDL